MYDSLIGTSLEILHRIHRSHSNNGLLNHENDPNREKVHDSRIRRVRRSGPHRTGDIELHANCLRFRARENLHKQVLW